MADVSQDMLAKNDENPVKIREYDSTAWMTENNGATPESICGKIRMSPLQYAKENDEKAYQIIK